LLKFRKRYLGEIRPCKVCCKYSGTFLFYEQKNLMALFLNYMVNEFTKRLSKILVHRPEAESMVVFSEEKV